MLNISVLVAFLMAPDETGDEADDIWQRSRLSAGTSRAVFIQLSTLNCYKADVDWMEHHEELRNING